MPIDTMQKELLVHISLFLGNKDRGQLGCTAKPFKNLDIEKALCSESVTIDGYLLNKIRLYTLPDTTNQDIDQPRAEASATAIKELVIASDAAKDLTNDDLEILANIGFIHNKTETINLKNCDQITDLSPLASCTELKDLNLIFCDQITDLSPLASCTALTSLDLMYCDQITDLSPLASCTSLTNVDLRSCTSIRNLSPLINHPTLSNLIDRNGEKVDLASLSNTQRLYPLNICLLS